MFYEVLKRCIVRLIVGTFLIKLGILGYALVIVNVVLKGL